MAAIHSKSFCKRIAPNNLPRNVANKENFQNPQLLSAIIQQEVLTYLGQFPSISLLV